MSSPVIMRRSEPAGTRQKRTSCQLTDGTTLRYAGFRFTLVARGQKTHRVGVPMGQEEAFYRAALKECGWSEEEIKATDLATVGDTIKAHLFDRRDTPYGANMAFDFRVNAREVCNEETVSGINGSIQQGNGSVPTSALDALKAKVEELRARTTTTNTPTPMGKTKK